MNRAPARVSETDTESLYDRDFVAWTQRVARLLRARQMEGADVDRVALEIEDMGKRDASRVDSRMQVLVAHLLKWQIQPARRSRSWTRTIATQRLEIDAALEQSPSLRRRLATRLSKNYGGAVKRAVADTGLGRDDFPEDCPYSLDQILSETFLP